MRTIRLAWAKFREQTAAVKMHTLVDLHGNIPTFIGIADGTMHDVKILNKTPGVRSDHTVILTAINSAKAYPDALGRVS